MVELKSCPFCGGKAKFDILCNHCSHNRVGFDFSIRCSVCGVSRGKGYSSIDITLSENGDLLFSKDERSKAVEFWNKRSDGE